MRLARFFVLITLLAGPTIGHAAYNNPTIESREVQPNGYMRIIFRFTGNAGEQDVRIPFVLRPGMTDQEVRWWVDDTIVSLDAAMVTANRPAAQVGQTVPRLARPAKTAKQIWQQKLSRYLALKDSGLTGAPATALAAMKTDLETSYQAGFLDE